MGKIYESITELIGRTPLLRLNGYIKKNGLNADILGKIEFFNPNQSIKDRIALSMIEEAEKNGSLKKGGTILEATSGNTGIGLSAIAAVKGYKTHIYVQDTVSEERFKVMRAFGTEVSNMSDVPEVDKALKENPLKGEYLIPRTVGDLVNEGKATVKILPSEDKWFGVTYKQDKEAFVKAINEKIADGMYPKDLWK